MIRSSCEVTLPHWTCHFYYITTFSSTIHTYVLEKWWKGSEPESIRGLFSDSLLVQSPSHSYTYYSSYNWRKCPGPESVLQIQLWKLITTLSTGSQMITKEFKTHHPKICYFGILIILSYRHLKKAKAERLSLNSLISLKTDLLKGTQLS